MKALGESFKISYQFVFIFALFIENNVCYCILLSILKHLKRFMKRKKNHFKKITVSCQFSICKISNFGMDQLRDMGRIQW